MINNKLTPNTADTNPAFSIPPEYAKLSLRDAREIYMYVEKKHILDRYSFPKKPGKDGYYRIYVADGTKKSGRRQLFAKSLSELMDKVYDYERGKN